jgi:hypothetical protein
MPKDPCQPIRDRIAKVEQNISNLEVQLEGTTGFVKKIIEEAIKAEREHLKSLEISLNACEKAKKSA